MKILLTGSAGQAGRAIIATKPDWADIAEYGRDALDITDERAVLSELETTRPECIINAAAYTDVELAESHEVDAEAVNVTGVANLARAGRAIGCRMLHISTDYVFAGDSGRPLMPQDETGPLNAYGRTKLAGETALLETLGERGCIIRTSWLYYQHGHNFVHTMLRLMNEHSTIRVVCDQFAAPTWARSLGEAIWAAVGKEIGGTWHWRDEGAASWYDFALAISELGQARRLVQQNIEILPVLSTEYPTKARRPACSLMDISRSTSALGIRPGPWRTNLGLMLEQLADA